MQEQRPVPNDVPPGPGSLSNMSHGLIRHCRETDNG